MAKTRKTAEPAQRVLNLRDELEETDVSQIPFATTVRFRADLPRGMHVTQASPCRELIMTGLGICLSKPQFLSHSNALRFAALLLDLQHFDLPLYACKDTRSTAAVEQPMSSLSVVLVEWVMSQFKGVKSNILPPYALATADFLVTLIGGVSRLDPEPWKIEPIFGEELSNDRSLKYPFDTAFKRQFTQMAYPRFIARVPPKQSVKYRDETYYSDGQEFVFEVRRCYLSESFHDFTFLRIDGPTSEPRLNLAEDFLLKGNILTLSHGFDGYATKVEPFHLPPGWIVAERQYSGEVSETIMVSLPKIFQPSD